MGTGGYPGWLKSGFARRSAAGYGPSTPRRGARSLTSDARSLEPEACSYGFASRQLGPMPISTVSGTASRTACSIFSRTSAATSSA